MKLYPEGLGEISVTMVCKNSKLTLHIQTDNTAAQKLIEDRAGELKTALLTKNFEVTDLRVGAGQNAADNMRGGFSFFRQDSQNGAYDQNDGRPTYGHFENRPRTEETPLFKTWEDLYTPGRLNYRA
ncbi:hypothetical protein SDC9_210141 [bioreactor metagenome]|uniref:Flagellar hook-length control protein-like C-terminal domain-containing protein n=1 Tax=bioreactor metagenome TaxID=1076179 RepID=A0A645JQ56_9ZZZZ